MRSRDFAIFAAWAAGVLLLLAPAWFRPSVVLRNFGDLYAYHYPLRHLVFSSLQAGRLPFWNPYIFGGLPLAANPQSVLFYPGALPGAFFPLTLALTWGEVLHLLWGGLGIILLARQARLSAGAALLALVLYMLSPFVIYRIVEGIPTLLASLCWVPWVWLAWLSGLPGLLAAAWAFQFLSGHPQFLVINAAAMGVWAACRPARLERSVRRFAREGLAALALTTVQWVPTFEFLGHSTRRGWPEAFTLGYSLDWHALATAAWPGAWGSPLDGSFSGPPSVFFESAGATVGLVGLLLAAAAAWKGRSRPAFVLIAVGVFLALGGHNPLYRALIRSTPLGVLRTPTRYLFLSLWGLMLAAAAGARKLAAGTRLPLTLLCAAAVAVELVCWDRHFLGTESAAPFLGSNATLAQQIGGAPFRVLTDPELANPNKTMLYRAMNANGYEAFYLGSFPAWAARSEGRPAVDASRAYLSKADTPEMSRLGVAYLVTKDGRLLPNPNARSLAYFVDAGGKPLKSPLNLSIERPERWRILGVKPAAGDTLVLAQPSYPGWSVRLDGAAEPLRTWDGLLQAVDVGARLAPGQRFELVADYVPTAWPLWAALSLLGWAAGAWFWGRGLAAFR